MADTVRLISMAWLNTLITHSIPYIYANEGSGLKGHTWVASYGSPQIASSGCQLVRKNNTTNDYLIYNYVQVMLNSQVNLREKTQMWTGYQKCIKKKWP